MKISILVPKVPHHQQKQQHLHSKANQITENNTQRHNQTRKIYFAENAGIIPKNSTGFSQTIGKIIPSCNPREEKQKLRQAIGADTGQVSKHKSKNDGSQEWLYEKPKRPQNCLLVKTDEISLDKQKKQISVIPNISEFYIKK